MSANTGYGFGDVDKHQEKKNVYNKLRAAIDSLQRHFLRDHSLVQKLQGFIPHLNRTDKDHGSLPFFSKEYVSLKPKREHCVLCLVSKVVQDYWDFADDTIEDSEMVLFFKNITILEAIAADGFVSYRVTGKYPVFYIDTITNIETALAAVEDAAQIEADEQAQIDAGIDEAEYASRGEETDDDENDATDAGSAGGANDSPATQAESVDKTPDGDNDQLPTELADKCSGDCDTCNDKVCDTTEAKGIPDVPVEEDQEIDQAEEREDNIEGGVVGGGSVLDDEDTPLDDDIDIFADEDQEEVVSMETATGETVDGIDKQLDEQLNEDQEEETEEHFTPGESDAPSDPTSTGTEEPEQTDDEIEAEDQNH